MPVDIRTNELDLEYAAAVLGLPIPQPEHKPKARKARPIARIAGRQITLAVRKKDETGAPYGNVIHFTHQCSSVFRTTALLEAEKAAKAEGFEPWYILDDGGDT